MNPEIDKPVEVVLSPKRKRNFRPPSIPEGIRDAVLKSQNEIMEQVRRSAPKRAGIFAKVYEGSASLRTAIKAKCLECGGFTAIEVTECRVYTCPLHRYRPYQVKSESDA